MKPDTMALFAIVALDRQGAAPAEFMWAEPFMGTLVEVKTYVEGMFLSGFNSVEILDQNRDPIAWYSQSRETGKWSWPGGVIG